MKKNLSLKVKEAKDSLAKSGIPFTKKNFIDETVKGNLKAVKDFIDAGINLNTTIDQNGMTAIMLAAANGQVEIVEHLISKGAKKNLNYLGIRKLRAYLQNKLRSN